ncbi:MAG: hypothetical protein JWQ03_3053 [Variovorax sp.]|nr:hypothetical protein [Variovorax sp.]
MKRDFVPERLDVAAFAEAATPLEGRDPLQSYSRLAAEASQPAENTVVQWEALGAERGDAGDRAAPWLHLRAEATLPLTCQRCLGPVDTALKVDRWFRFAADEATAALEDEDADEDVLALSREFNLRALVEDELLMEIPIAPTHDVCPQPVRLSVADEDFEAPGGVRPNPFAVLDGLRTKKPD